MKKQSVYVYIILIFTLSLIPIISILFKFRGRLIYLKNKLLILQYLFFLKFKFFSFTTEFE